MVTDLAAIPFPKRYPKYIFGSGYKWGAMDYGAEDVAIVLVFNPSTADHNAWKANADLMALPENLNQNMTAGAVTAAQTFLESINIPAGWINTTRTYKQVIKIVAGLFQFAQRWNGISILAGDGSQSPFKEGMNLNTKYNQMSAKTKSKLRLA